MNSEILAVSIGISAVFLSGCGPVVGRSGIVPADGPNLNLNTALAPTVSENDVKDPDTQRFNLIEMCGHLVELQPDKTYRPLFIAAYPATSAPKMLSSATGQVRYHFLVDNGGAASLKAAYGPGAADISVSGEDRLEVTVTTIALCSMGDLDKDAVGAAVKQLSALNVDLNKIYVASTASDVQLSVNLLHSISTNANGAATPIVNFGGNNYSKEIQAKTTDFVGLSVIPVSVVQASQPGATVSPLPAATAALNVPASIGRVSAAALISQNFSQRMEIGHLLDFHPKADTEILTANEFQQRADRPWSADVNVVQ